MKTAFPFAFCWVVSTIPQALVAGFVVKTLKELLPGIKLWHTIAAAMDKKTTHWSRL
jgi:hypothetical protein